MSLIGATVAITGGGSGYRCRVHCRVVDRLGGIADPANGSTTGISLPVDGGMSGLWLPK